MAPSEEHTDDIGQVIEDYVERTTWEERFSDGLDVAAFIPFAFVWAAAFLALRAVERLIGNRPNMTQNNDTADEIGRMDRVNLWIMALALVVLAIGGIAVLTRVVILG